MLEPREADIPVLFLVLVVLPLAAYILLGKWSDAAEKRERVSLLAQLAAEETHRAEAMTTSCAIPLVPTSRIGIHVCAECFGPATTRCARCKSVRYCSGKCQIIHWRQVHRHECQRLETTTSWSSPKATSAEDSIPEGLSVRDSLNSFHFGTKSKQGMVDSAQSDDVVDPLTRIGNSAANSFFAVDTSQGAMLHRSSTDRRVSCMSNREMLIRAEEAGFVPLKETSEIRSINTTKLARQDTSVPCGTHNKAKVLFPYEEYMKIFNCEFVSLSPKGLLNCGNSCYANAVLQCLTCTKPLIIFLLRRSHSRSCFGKDWCLMCELEQLVTMLRETGDPLSPSRILLHIQNSSCQIGDGSQEDAHEFLRLLVASMQSICLEGLGGEEKVDPRLQETTFIQHTFGGCLRSKVKCLRCHRESERYEKIMDLTLEIFGWVESLEDALTQFTSSEELDGENMYRCGRCAAYVRARKQLSIDEAPNILTIVLKRFKEGKYGKINKCISFPEMLDITPFMTEMGDDTPLYMLYAVVVHLDTLNASFTGHYIAYVKDLQGSWFRIDDTEVHPVSIDHVMSEGAYILFYMRTYPRPPRAFNQIAIPKYARHIISRTQKPSRQRQSESSCHFVGSEHSLDLKSENITGLRSHACGISKKKANRDIVHVDFSDATSSDRSLFTSSDDASFTTESTRDSFSTMDNVDMFSSIFNNLGAPESSSSSTICCRTFLSGKAETRYFSEEKGYVLDSFFSNHPAKRIWRMENFKKVSDSLAELRDGSYGSVKYGSSMSRTSSHCKQ